MRLTDQLRRAARLRSGANISEASRKNGGMSLTSVSKLTELLTENRPKCSLVSHGDDCDYLAEQRCKLCYSKSAQELGKCSGAMMADPDKWCRNANRDRKSKLSG